MKKDKFIIGTTYSGSGQWYSHLTIQTDGKVGIGTATPEGNTFLKFRQPKKLKRME